MARKTRTRAQPWWRRRRPLRRLAVAVALALVVGVVAWLVVRGEGGSGGGSSEYLREPAPPFTMPTVAGDEVSLSDHVGRHNLLLYFNEGMG